MNRLLTATKCLLGTVALGAGLTAHAQTITLGTNVTPTNLGTVAAATAAQVGGGGLQYACVPYSLVSPQTNLQTFVFAPGANNEVIDKWTLQGDGVATTGTTGTTFTFAPTGFGKARVTVSYYYNTGATTPVFCPGGTVPILCNGVQLSTPVRAFATRTYEFSKTFTQAQAGYIVKGPTCVPTGNPSVVYSVEPAVISTVAQVRAGLADTYVWTVNYVASGGGVPFSRSGDGSTIIIDGTALTGSFNVSVQVGQCNAANPSFLVTVAPNINTAVLTPNLTCLPTNATSTTFTVNTVTGVNYTLGTNVGTLSATTLVGNNALQTVTLSGLTSASTGSVSVTGIGSGAACFGTQTAIRPLTRKLVIGTNLIAPVCVTPGVAATLTLSNAPLTANGQPINWTVTGTGWTINSGQGTSALVVTPGPGPATVTAQAGTCNAGGGVITQVVGVNGPVTGCNLTIVNSGTIAPGITPGCSFTASVPAAPCPLNNANRYTVWRLYDLSRALPLSNQLVETVNVPLAFQSTGSISFAYQTSIAGTARVEVDVVNTASGGLCLKATFGTSLLNYVFCPPGGRAAAPGNGGAAAKLARQEVRAYPNPSDGQLTIDLTPAEGSTQLSLVDALGRTVQKTTTDQARAALDVRGLPAGTYTLRAVRPGGKVLNQAVQVQH